MKRGRWICALALAAMTLSCKGTVDSITGVSESVVIITGGLATVPLGSPRISQLRVLFDGSEVQN